MKITVFVLPTNNSNEHLDATGNFKVWLRWNAGTVCKFHLAITRDKRLLTIPQNINTTNQMVASLYKTKDK